MSKRRSVWRSGTPHPITTDNTLSVGGAYSFRDGWQGQRDNEHTNRPDAVPSSMGSGALIQAAGSNYSVDLSAGTEAIVGHYPVLSER